jgi:hypothetical protein
MTEINIITAEAAKTIASEARTLGKNKKKDYSFLEFEIERMYKAIRSTAFNGENSLALYYQCPAFVEFNLSPMIWIGEAGLFIEPEETSPSWEYIKHRFESLGFVVDVQPYPGRWFLKKFITTIKW